MKSGSSDETRDAWTIGYTPQLVAGVWVGNANNAPIPNGTSTYTAAPIWRAFMLAALQGQPALAFQKPNTPQAKPTQPPSQSGGLKQTETPKPTRTLRPADPTETPRPTRTLRPADATETPKPTNTPRPTRTPQGNGNQDDDDD